VLLTGHTGFKGSWLALWLHSLGARVSGYALAPPTQPNNFSAARVAEVLAASYEANLLDRAALKAAVRATEPRVILHLAARTVVRESYRDPVDTFETNVIGTVQLLDVVRELARPCAVVVVTSDKCYHNDESGRRLGEDEPMGGFDPYSASKGAAEIATASYCHSYFDPAKLERHGIAVATARAGNVVGGGDWTPDGLVADSMRALLADQPIHIRNPAAIRPWQHVLEPLSGYLTLAARLLGPDAARYCGGWNFGPDASDDATVREVVERLLRAWGEGRWIDGSRPGELHEAGVLRLENRKARETLGWRPAWRLDEAIERTARWFASYRRDPSRAREACLADIAAHMSARTGTKA